MQYVMSNTILSTKEIYMKLRKWLNLQKLTNRAFSKMINTSESAINRWTRTDTLGRIPRQKYMASIEKATGGKVKPQDFYS